MLFFVVIAFAVAGTVTVRVVVVRKVAVRVVVVFTVTSTGATEEQAGGIGRAVSCQQGGPMFSFRYR